MFELKLKLVITEVNKFYKRSVDVTTLGDSKKQARTDYIFVGGKEKETGTYFYYNFPDSEALFAAGNKFLLAIKNILMRILQKLRLMT